MLQVFLHVALYAAVRLTNLPRHPAHLPHIAFAEQDGHGHNEYQNARQPHIQPGKEIQRTAQLDDSHEYGGDSPANGIGHGCRVRLYPVE